MLTRVAVLFLAFFAAIGAAAADEAYVSFDRPAETALGSWAKADGLDVAWDVAGFSKTDSPEQLSFSLGVSPVSARLADLHRTGKRVDALYLRIAGDDGAERFFKLSKVTVTGYLRAAPEKLEALETVTIVCERIQRVQI